MSAQEKRSHKEPYDFLHLFVTTSNIHGCQYLTAKGRHWVESALWVICVILGISGSIYISISSFYRFQNDPTVIAIERDYLNWNTSIPSVTICPTQKLDPIKLKVYLERFNEKDRNETERFIRRLANLNYTNLNDIHESKVNISADDYMKLLVSLRFPFKYEAKLTGANYSYRETITESGLCYAFNTQAAQYNHPSVFFSEGQARIVEKEMLTHGNPNGGDLLASILNMNSPYFAQFTGPNDVADIATARYEGIPLHYWAFSFASLSTVVSNDIRPLTIKQRKCRFHDESDLTISEVYSYNQCRMNCRWKLCQDLCGCAPHFYRKVDGVKTCDAEGLKCLSAHEDFLGKLRDKNNIKTKCNCLPTCTDQAYYLELSKRFSWFMGSNLKYGIYIFPRMRIRRELIFGFPDLLVSIGGTAGLFLGCSVLSFFEIVYFLTIRLFFYVRNHRKMMNSTYQPAQKVAK